MNLTLILYSVLLSLGTCAGSIDESNSTSTTTTYVISSLNADSSGFFTTTVVIDASNDATISTTSRSVQSGDTTAVYILLNDMDYTLTNDDDEIEYEATNLPSGVNLYYVDIDLSAAPVQAGQGGSPIVTFLCQRKSCQPSDFCDITSFASGDWIHLRCETSCNKCPMRATIVSSNFSDVTGGFYLPVKSITYD